MIIIKKDFQSLQVMIRESNGARSRTYDESGRLLETEGTSLRQFLYDTFVPIGR